MLTGTGVELYEKCCFGNNCHDDISMHFLTEMPIDTVRSRLPSSPRAALLSVNRPLSLSSHSVKESGFIQYGACINLINDLLSYTSSIIHV